MSTFKEKYIKYKKKYIELKYRMKGGTDVDLKKAIAASKKNSIKRKNKQKLMVTNRG